MAVQQMEVRHRCGCTRRYSTELPATLQQSVQAQMRERDCGYMDCPRRPQRLLARTAPMNANGKGES